MASPDKIAKLPDYWLVFGVAGDKVPDCSKNSVFDFYNVSKRFDKMPTRAAIVFPAFPENLVCASGEAVEVQVIEILLVYLDDKQVIYIGQHIRYVLP
jgi:hypothetical protein